MWPHFPSSSPGLIGRSSTPRPIGSSTALSGIPVAPLNAAHDSGSSSRSYPSRSAIAPELCELVGPRNRRAQGMSGEGLTHGPPAAKSWRQSPQIQPNHPAFPARWCYGFPGGPGFLAPVARNVRHACELDLSVGRSGPHDLTVRDRRVRLTWHCVHRIPASRVVTDRAYVPLCRGGMRGGDHGSPKNGIIIFFAERLGRGISTESPHEFLSLAHSCVAAKIDPPATARLVH
jgi:hypothetical protein